MRTLPSPLGSAMTRNAQCSCGSLRVEVTGELALLGVCHGLPTPQWFGFWRRLLFPERSGARRGSKQGLRAHRRFGAKGRTAFLPQLRLHRVLVRGSIPAPCRHLLWGIRRSFDALAPCIRVGDHAASLGDFRSQSCSLSGSTLARRTARRADGQPELRLAIRNNFCEPTDSETGARPKLAS